MQTNFYTHTAVLAAFLAIVASLPTSLIEDIKANELRDNKVKRAHDTLQVHEENPRQPVAYFSNPTAIKRGTNLKNDNLDPQNGSEWEPEDMDESLGQLPASLYNNDQQFDDKTFEDYQKGFRYASNKDKLDEALENAVLKSELYGDPAAVNQYRYYGAGAEERRRRRRDAQKRLDSRLKREVELSPEDMLAILTLWESEHQRPRTSWRDNIGDNDRSDEESGEEEENWLNTPVYPHVSSHPKPLSPNYIYEKEGYDKRNLGQWGGDSKKKRFMVARKRNDPSRYLSNVGTNDYLALSQLLNSQREPNLPVYRRLML